jgi:hypothetical protein
MISDAHHDVADRELAATPHALVAESWALRYAGWGWKILPLHTANRGRCSCRDPECASPGKHPRTAHGVHDASRRPEQVRRWWASWPDANVAIATGPLVIVDVDGEQGHATLVALQARHGRALPATAWVQTARGRHLYLLAPGLEVPNSSGRVGSGVDVRGAGGYVVAPPSRHASGPRYRWHGLHGGIAMLPHWLAQELTTPPAINRPSTSATVTVPDAYLRAALSGELARVTAAPHGTRNDTLNRAAFRLGQLAADHRDDPNALKAPLLDAALAIGLGEREARTTIDSGVRAGLKRPRSMHSIAARPARDRRDSKGRRPGEVANEAGGPK